MMKEKEKMILEEMNRSVQPGDIVFISIPNPLYRRVAKTTNSWTSHVGFVYGKKGDDWMVAESSFPLSKQCTLKKFLERSEGGQISVKRLDQALSQEDIDQLRRSADKRMKVWYHTGFKLHSKRQFCSKFVHEVFKEALGVEVGEVETFKELLSKNDETPMLFWRLWYFGFIPWDRETITPASQYNSEKLLTVYESLLKPVP